MTDFLRQALGNRRNELLRCTSAWRRAMHWRVFSLVMLLNGYALGAPAHADLLERLNQLRFEDCKRSAGKLPVLRRNTDLDAVAVEWSKGIRLTEAVTRTSYPSHKLASMKIIGNTQDEHVIATLRQGYCEVLTDARYSEVGLLRRKNGVWIVVAAPLAFPSVNDAAALAKRVLDLVNAARGQPRTCGASEFDATGPVRASRVLDKAALTHASDMAQNQHFQHQGTDGSNPGVRATLGTLTAEYTVQSWLESPGHCAIIMQPEFTEMGVGYAVTYSGKPNIYWSQVFAQPRS
jgi:uncharacterized protein YkwD